MIDQATLEKHLAALESAIKTLGESARTANGSPGSPVPDEHVIGSVLGSSVGIACQLYGVEKVKTVLENFVSGPVASQFWALQKELYDAAHGPEPAAAPQLETTP